MIAEPRTGFTQNLTGGLSFVGTLPRATRKVTNSTLSFPVGLVDSYSEVNADGYATFIGLVGFAQSFTGNGLVLSRTVFSLKRLGSVTGNMFSKIYAHSGIFGTTSVPTGTALATSDPIDVTTIGTTGSLFQFSFSGANQIVFTNGTHYCVSVEFTGGGDFVNSLSVGSDSIAPINIGNFSQLSGGVWTSYNLNALCFYVYSSSDRTFAKNTRRDLTSALFQGAAVTGVVDSYSEINQNASTSMSGSGTSGGGFGVCFTANGAKITDSKWYLGKHSLPTGNVVSKLYTMTGTFGVSGTAGTLLATSDNVDVSTLSGTALITFPFSGAQQYTTTNGTNYFISVEYNGGDGGNYLDVFYDSTGTHPGTWAFYASGGGSWTPVDAGLDFPFYVDGITTSGGATASLIKRAGKTFSATSSFVGSVATSVGHFFLKAFTATISPTATFGRKTLKSWFTASLWGPSALSDDFNRADGSLGSGWTSLVAGGLAISSNKIVGTIVGSDTGSYRVAESYTPDQYSEISVTATPAVWIAPTVRNGGDNLYLGLYYYNFGSPYMQIYKRVSGTYTALGSFFSCGTLAVGTRLRLEVAGGTLIFSQDGVIRNLVYDTSLTSGTPGIAISGTDSTDNWVGSSQVYDIKYMSTDGNGVETYVIVSRRDGNAFHFMRVLRPTSPTGGRAHQFLYALPVEPDTTGYSFGDPVNILRTLNAHNAYNVTIVSPEFFLGPWYADHPTDDQTRYESFFTQELCPWVRANLATSGSEQHWLLGFSKSGFGGLDLLLKHPDLFTIGAFWDMPSLSLTTYNTLAGGMSENYGTDANFQANYRMTDAFLNTYKAPFVSSNRIWFSGYALYQTDVANLDAKLTSLGITHTLFPQVNRGGHSWSSGWVPDALAGLYTLSTNVVWNPILIGSATLTLSTGKVLSATISFVGAIRRAAVKGLTATLSFVGSLVRKIFHVLTSTLSFIGNLASIFSHFGITLVQFTSSLSFVGVTTRIDRHLLTATRSFVGVMTKRGLKTFTGVLFSGGSGATGTTWVSDGTPSNIQTLHNSFAVNGDTITIPAGAFTWSTGITLTKSVKLQGAGSGRVIARSGSSVTIGTGTKTFTLNAAGISGITNGMTLTVERTGTIVSGGNATGTRGTMIGTVSSYSGTTLTMNITSSSGSGTQGVWMFITNPTTTVTSTAGTTTMVDITENTTGNVEISGIRFIPTTTGAVMTFNRNGANGKPILVHDCYFEMSNESVLEVRTSRGVVWNCSFAAYPFSLAPLFAHMKAEGQSQDGWTNTSTMGSADDGTHNIYFEACDFNAALNASDSDDNIRSVFRHCIFNNAGQGSHGADTSNYGVRHYEVYDCTFIFNGFGDGQTLNLNWWFFLRGGTGVITDNVLPALSSTDYGDKLEINMTVMNLQRGDGPHPCWGAGIPGNQYPAPRQVGMGRVTGAGGSDTFAYNGDSEPLYIWNNTGGYAVGTSDFGGSDCSSPDSTANYVVSGRDYFNDGTAKPGYTKFTYPHPLTTTSVVTVSSGSLSKKTFKLISVIQSFVGSVATSLSHTGSFFLSFGANLLFVGNISRKPFRRLTSTLSFVGAFTSPHTFFKQLTGVLWGGGTAVLDSYSETNSDSSFLLPSSHAIGQAFNSGSGGTLDSCKFYLDKVSSPSGNVLAKLFVTTGTLGTSAIPTGVALATSDPVLATSLPPTPQLVTFSFTGANRYVMSSSTVYAIACEYASGPIGVDVYRDGSTPTHAGNSCIQNVSDIWSAFSALDVIFYVYVGSGTASIATLTRRTGRSLTAIRSFIVSMSANIIHTGGLFLQGVAGSLSFVGTFNKKTNKRLTAVSGFVGNLIGFLSHAGTNFLSLASNLLFVGAVNKRTSRGLVAILGFVGNLFKRATKDLVAVLSFVGFVEIATGFQKLFTATLSFIGSLTTTVPHHQLLTATLTFSGNLGKSFLVALTATLVFISQLTKNTNKFFNTTLSFIGALVRGFVGEFRYYIDLRPNQFKPTKTTFRTTAAKSSNFRYVKTNDDS